MEKAHTWKALKFRRKNFEKQQNYKLFVRTIKDIYI